MKKGRSVADGSGSTTRRASEVLEGEHKARSGDNTGWVQPTGVRSLEHVKVHTERWQGRRRSQEAKPSATAAGQTLKVSATPRRVWASQPRRDEANAPRCRGNDEPEDSDGARQPSFCAAVGPD